MKKPAFYGTHQFDRSLSFLKSLFPYISQSHAEVEGSYLTTKLDVEKEILCISLLLLSNLNK